MSFVGLNLSTGSPETQDTESQLLSLAVEVYLNKTPMYHSGLTGNNMLVWSLFPLFLPTVLFT